MSVFCVSGLLAAKIYALVTNEALLGRSVLVPIGISFLCLQLVAMGIENAKPVNKPMTLVDAGIISFLPSTRICGPIVRWRQIRRGLDKKVERDVGRLLTGLGLIGLGILQKRYLGDELAAFAFAASDQTILEQTVGGLGRVLSVYFDASGFGVIAVGCGRVMGLAIPASFAYPLTKANGLSDFWRRWQTPIMGWFRDYVYGPIRGPKGNSRRAVLALAGSFLASALWHGLHPLWLVWGAVTVGLMYVDDWVAKSTAGLPSVLVVVSRITRRVLLIVYMVTLTSLLLAFDGRKGDSATWYLQRSSTLFALGVLLVAVVALLVRDKLIRDWPTGAFGIFLQVCLAVAGILTLVLDGSLKPFVYQRL